jgi:hypothetical protein
MAAFRLQKRSSPVRAETSTRSGGKGGRLRARLIQPWMYGRSIRARSSRDLSVRWCKVHRRIVCRIAFSACGLAAGRKEVP